MKWLLKLAWKNMWRNRTRTIITMASVFFAVLLSVFASSLKQGVFDNLVKNVVSFYTGYIQVHRNGYWNEQILDNSFRDQPVFRKKLLSDKNVAGLTYRLESFALASSPATTKGCMVIGIDPGNENQVTSLEKKLLRGTYLNQNDRAVLIAEGLAKHLQINIHDTLVLIGQGYHGSTAAGKYPVKGILKFGAPDLNEKALFLPLAAAQEFYDAEGLFTSCILSLHETDQVPATTLRLQQNLPGEYEVMNWGQMLPEIKQHIETDTNNMKYVQGILYLLIGFGIFGTLLMMMVERKFEMGMLVAIGMKKSKLILLLLIESTVTVLMGCMLGILTSIPLVLYFKSYPIRIGGEASKAYERFGFEAIFPTASTADIFGRQGITVLIIGLILSLYPVYKIIRLNAVDAMKR